MLCEETTWLRAREPARLRVEATVRVKATVRDPSGTVPDGIAPSRLPRKALFIVHANPCKLCFEVIRSLSHKE